MRKSNNCIGEGRGTPLRIFKVPKTNWEEGVEYNESIKWTPIDEGIATDCTNCIGWWMDYNPSLTTESPSDYCWWGDKQRRLSLCIGSRAQWVSLEKHYSLLPKGLDTTSQIRTILLLHPLNVLPRRHKNPPSGYVKCLTDDVYKPRPTLIGVGL